MRYRDGADALARAAPSQDFVTVTVWMTVVIGILFFATGIYARQSWLTFWGGLTVLVCIGYFVYF